MKHMRCASVFSWVNSTLYTGITPPMNLFYSRIFPSLLLDLIPPHSSSEFSGRNLELIIRALLHVVTCVCRAALYSFKMSSQEITYMGLKGRPLGLVISTIATTGFLLFGYDQGVMSGIISAKQFNNYFPETRNNSVYQGFVTAIYEIGCLLGAIFILSFGDRVGRRRSVS